MAASRKKKTALEASIDALPADLRDLVVERASIIAESGDVDWPEAERQAYEQETGRASPGPARAQQRPAESEIANEKSAAKTTKR